jgi:hypothetical protein
MLTSEHRYDTNDVLYSAIIGCTMYPGTRTGRQTLPTTGKNSEGVEHERTVFYRHWRKASSIISDLDFIYAAVPPFDL